MSKSRAALLQDLQAYARVAESLAELTGVRELTILDDEALLILGDIDWEYLAASFRRAVVELGDKPAETPTPCRETPHER